MQARVGEEPTSAERALIESAKALTPEKSLDRIDALARFVFANVAVVGTLLTGLGFLRASADYAGGTLLTTVALFVALSLLLSLGATAPRLTRVRSADLVALERWYRRQVVRRGVLAITSAVALAAAVSLAVIFAVTRERPGPLIDAEATRSADGSLLVRLNVSEVPSSRSIALIVGTRARAGSAVAPVCTSRTRAHVMKSLRLVCAIAREKRHGTVIARVREGRSGHRGREYVIEVN